MILACGGIKGGVGKTLLALNLAIMRASAGFDVLVIDGDEQETASNFTSIRNAAPPADISFTAVKLTGTAIRPEGKRLAAKYDDVIIDVGGHDATGQRAALSIADRTLVPILPSSFDIWSLEKTANLIEEAQIFNDKLKAFVVINRAEAQGNDNQEAADLINKMEGLILLDGCVGNRKIYRKAAAAGRAVIEFKPKHNTAILEMQWVYDHIFDIGSTQA